MRKLESRCWHFIVAFARFFPGTAAAAVKWRPPKATGLAIDRPTDLPPVHLYTLKALTLYTYIHTLRLAFSYLYAHSFVQITVVRVPYAVMLGMVLSAGAASCS